MRRITRSWASQSTWPSGPNGITGTAAAVASALRRRSRVMGIPSGGPLLSTLRRAPSFDQTRGGRPAARPLPLLPALRRPRPASFAQITHHVLDTRVVLEPVHRQVLAVAGV